MFDVQLQWIWNKIILGILNHWDPEYQDSNDSASTPYPEIFTIYLTWDQALFSFRFENYIPAGMYENR